jgi:hypothetical protein
MKKFKAISAFLIGCVSFGAIAAPQCITSGSGTYGSNTVTITGCSTFSSAYGAFAANESQLLSTSCVYTFSSPISTTGLQIKLDSVDAGAVSVSLDGNAYVSTAADIGSLTGSQGTAALTISGSGYAGGNPEAAGTVTLTNSPPATVTALTLTKAAGGSSHLSSVCFNDAPSSPASIPTLSEWAMLFMASLMAMFGIRRMRRNK